MTNKVIYIAGPYRAKNAYWVEQNIRKAEEVAMEVAATGCSFICPHSMTRYFDGTLTDEYWLAMTMELLRRCDAVMLCRGWEQSAGSRAEVEDARRLGLPVFDHMVLAGDEWLEALR